MNVRWKAVLAVAAIGAATATMTSTASPAGAAEETRAPAAWPLPASPVDPTGPVAALRRQFADRGSVRIAEITTNAVNGAAVARVRTESTIGFGENGPYSTQVTFTSDTPGTNAMAAPGRNWPIITDDSYYPDASAARYDDGFYPEAGAPRFDDVYYPNAGTPRYGEAGAPAVAMSGPVQVLEPATLRALLLTSYTGRQPSEILDGQQTTVMSGTISMSELHRVSEGFRRAYTAYEPETRVHWRLWLGRDDLPRRLTTTWSRIDTVDARMTTVNDARFSAWGRRLNTEADAEAAAKILATIPTLEQLTSQVRGIPVISSLFG
ncbi:hypothetical protein [Spongiactinospora sp. TRM90649]|uniref:hypothetical protein n=1 Tax=Spongiactinospora sp. TRM90649 TaxID=3031114 RepID=UPI0023F71F08|nr:hypothetical protein [Spongiactinospora sp. TRM90649]MDF5751335.1 hypothetical protein [Spongiactinospora sp. TRM90649]